jgi:parallel beta-helix repeat protein
MALGLVAAVPGAAMAAQPSCGDTLTTNTTLTANLDCSGYGGTALYMGANDVVLNLNGHTITGPAGYDSQSGVDTDNYNRTTIRNGKIQDYGYGVYLDSSNRTTVSGLDIDGNDTSNAYGVYDSYGVSNVLNNLEIWDVYYGVYAEYSARTTIQNSDITASYYGVYVYDGAKALVTGNSIHSDGYGVYDYEGWRNKYSGNTANGADYGFYLECNGYGPMTLTGNTANNTTYYGFYLTQCYEVDHPVIDYLGGTHVTGNTANEGDGYGFYDYYSYNEIWKNNVANDNSSYGFYFDYPSNARILSNGARRNGASGFYIDDNYRSYNVDDIAFNTARGNGDYGFYAGYGAPSHDNVAVNNDPNCYHVDCN